MRVIIVFTEFSDHAREVFEWQEEFERRTGREAETLNPETKEGEGFCMAHGVMEYPTILVMAEDGKVLEEWRGTPLPQIDTVMSYVVN